MNEGLQVHILKKVMEKNFRERRLPQEKIDEILDLAWEDHIDDTLELGENINNFYELGILVHVQSEEKLEEEQQLHLNFVQKNYIDSITTSVYHCRVDGCDYQTLLKKEMTKHFQDVHGLDDSRIPPKNPHDMTYIILDELLLLTMSKEYRNKKNFTVSNQYLWEKLLRRLEYKAEDKTAPSNQTPRRILDDLGLLDKHKYQKRNKIGYDKNSRREYHLNKEQLEDVILGSDFHDLKYKLD